MNIHGYTEWRRLIGSPKLQIIFHKRATKYRLLLRKMTYKDEGSYDSSPHCICVRVGRGGNGDGVMTYDMTSSCVMTYDITYSCHI